MTEGYMVYKRPFRVRFWRALGFHAPAPQLLTAEQTEQGWGEQVFVNTVLHVSFSDRVRLLFSGRAKLFTVVSAKVQVPEAITSVGFGVSYPGEAA